MLCRTLPGLLFFYLFLLTSFVKTDKQTSRGTPCPTRLCRAEEVRSDRISSRTDRYVLFLIDSTINDRHIANFVALYCYCSDDMVGVEKNVLLLLCKLTV